MIVLKDHHLDGKNLAEAILQVIEPYFFMTSMLGVKGFPFTEIIVNDDGGIVLGFSDDDRPKEFEQALAAASELLSKKEGTNGQS
jgi:hypothetical protein